MQDYIRFRNDSDRRAQKTAADSRVRDARARKIELRNAVRESRLIEVDEASDRRGHDRIVSRGDRRPAGARHARLTVPQYNRDRSNLPSLNGWQILSPKGEALWQRLALLARPSRQMPPDV
ncbi:hypothetical protein [Bradyrhizobium lablabi]|uniref:hypothetical protein n=1 Tax=Bradyrhizobium lablabi TaxID=722472 RepID=UPI0018F8C168|nr:hypothetical protein [Bradyrhizobium lablabi]